MRTSTNIYRRSDGLWEGRYKNGYKKDGKTRYTSIYAKSYQECKEKLETAKTTIYLSIDKRNIKVNDLFALYTNKIRKKSTLSTYKSVYDNHIKKAFGGQKVHSVTREQINIHLQILLYQFKESYVCSVKALIIAMFQYAYTEKMTAHKLENIIKIKIPKSKILVFGDEERTALENYCLNNLSKDTFCILLALFTGVRIGELCALTVGDIDAKTAFVTINKTMSRIKNMEPNATSKTKVIIDTPKSDCSIREIPLPAFLVHLYKQLYKECHKSSFLLTGTILNFISPRTLENRYKRILKQCHIKERNFHVLRHTFATDCLVKSYYDIKTLSEILGHSNPQMTLKKYIHITQKIKSIQVKRIDSDFISRIKYGSETKQAF